MSMSISKWGHSAALRIPKNILEKASFHVGDMVSVNVIGGAIVIEPAKPSLDQLLAMVNDENRHTEVFNDSVGNELL